MVNLPRLDNNIPIVTENRTPSLTFHQWWQTMAERLETVLTALQDAVDAIQQALDAADIAQQAADTAQAAGDAANSVASLTNSGVTGITLTATDAGASATVNVSSHTRIYGDGTRVTVEAGSVTGLAYSTLYYIYYEDAGRGGTGLTYQASTNVDDAAQVGNTHLVGTVTTPAALDPDTGGEIVRPPGVGNLETP